MARTRRNDPHTSALAAEDVEASGAAQAQRNLCLAEVIKQPGKTAAEIAHQTGLERHAPSRRLPELRDAGLVSNGRSRICAVTQRLSMTWFPVAQRVDVDTRGRGGLA